MIIKFDEPNSVEEIRKIEETVRKIEKNWKIDRLYTSLVRIDGEFYAYYTEAIVNDI